jgi:hypothetical protein
MKIMTTSMHSQQIPTTFQTKQFTFPTFLSLVMVSWYLSILPTLEHHSYSILVMTLRGSTLIKQKKI